MECSRLRNPGNVYVQSQPFTNVKTKLYSTCVMALLCWSAHGQGTFIYDQQSSSSDYSGGESSFDITLHQPMGQSFTPTLDSVGFVRLQLYDTIDNFLSVGATMSVNLWFGSIGGGGTLLGSTDPVYLPKWFGQGVLAPAQMTNFFFTTPITVTPGETYFLQPVVESGDTMNAYVAMGPYYLNGSLILNGTNNFGDLWFREGVYQTPEPWSGSLILLGGGILFCFRKKRKRQPS